ncbi:MAG: acyltransferase domain-containing protein [Planctomycetaceae bacterium]|nr:acyltransferase domain-containing protein [Planctomycetaceae bacterium]
MQVDERIAIVGWGGLFPGAPTLDQFWSNLLAARDAGRHVTGERWYLPPEMAYRPGEPSPDTAYSTWACLVDGFEFDPDGLDVDRDVLAGLDPVFSFGLHAAREAWRSAEMATVDPARVGVILGNIALPYESTSAAARDVLIRELAESLLGKDRARWQPSSWGPENRFVTGLPAAVIARALDLGGTAWTLDAACASSLYALKFACDELLSHRADAMLAGGLCRPDCQYTQFGFAQLQALTKHNRCRPLSAAADGLVVGEGAGIFVLKRLSDAVAQGDTILGVIAGIGLSNDRGANLLAPHSEGQFRAMMAAYQQAGWQPGNVDLVECHATGTPLGDQVELESLHRLWEKAPTRPGRTILGAVKSNIGHLLTGAAAAGVMKLLLALRHRTLPPTANFTQPAARLADPNSPFEVLTQPRPWDEPSSRPRRCAINAFGFGGINAHLLLEEWQPASFETSVSVPRSLEMANRVSERRGVLAIVGVGARLGSAVGWPEVRSRLLASDFGASTFDDVEIPLGEFRIPPAEVADMLPQQQVMLLTTAEALRESSVDRSLGNRAGVFVALELDPATSNFHARWSLEQFVDGWAAQLGVSLTDDDRTRWLEELRDSISPPLNATRVMGHLGGIVASRLAREFDIGGPCFTISSCETSAFAALRSAASALTQGELDLALVGAVDIASDPRTRQAMAALGRVDQPIDSALTLVLKRLDDAERDGDRVLAVIDTLPDDTDEHRLTLSADDYSAAGAAASGLALLTGLAALETSVRPRGKGTPPQPWLHDRIAGPRRVEIVATERAGRVERISLRKSPGVLHAAIQGPALPLADGLFVVTGESASELVTAVRTLHELVALSSDGPEKLAKAWFHDHAPRLDAPHALAFVASTREELFEQLNRVLESSESASGRRPGQNSIHRRDPSAMPGRVAFVFPGSGNAFAGMGRELLALFPQILERQHAANRELFHQYRPDMHWTGDTAVDHKGMIFGQVAIGTALCELLAEFGVRPSASLGYSLGESAAFFGLGAWPDRDEMLERMRQSPLFGSDLVLPFDAARTRWQIPATEAVPWLSGVIDRGADDVRRTIDEQSQAALLIVNTDRQCVIGGERSAVEDIVRRLGGNFVPLPSPSTVHCDVLRAVEDRYRALHTMRTTPPDGVAFYSTAWGRSYPLTAESAADAIVAQAVETIDFPRVVRQAYADGVRTFVEIGPGSSCTRMIADILAQQPHTVVPVCPATQSPVRAFLEAIAVLFVQGAVRDLSPLFGPAPVIDSRRKIRTPVAREPLTDITRPPRRSSVPVEPVIESPPPAFAPAAVAVRQHEELPLATTYPVSPSLTMASPPTVPVTSDAPVSWNAELSAPFAVLQQTLAARAQAHAAYLSLSEQMRQTLARVIESTQGDSEFASTAVMDEAATYQDVAPVVDQGHATPEPSHEVAADPTAPPPFMNREQCLQFAIGRIGDVLGERFAAIDGFPTRVRLPDEPLMLVDRIVSVEGEPLSMTHGRVVTEHDILPNAWYLDCGRIPTCIAVESGQADLFLSGWLGVDLQTRGLACYRLLDAVVTFHEALPRPGETIHYDIRVLKFFRQGETWLFRFEFDATVNGQPVLTMREGCAGFFTDEELGAGKGIIHTALDRQPQPGKLPADWAEPMPLAAESYDDDRIRALRRGDLAGCFGPAFANLPLNRPVTLPTGRMELLDRVLAVEPGAGKYGLGRIRGEMDIAPDDWFLTCHFCDDQVMPGTLMYECCLHTLRVYLLRLGWIGEDEQIAYEPIPGVRSRLKCRGQVIASTKTVWYEVTIKELGYGDQNNPGGAPYCIADALMYADGRPIVEITDMSVRLSGLTRDAVEELWRGRGSRVESQGSIERDAGAPLFDTASITEFAIGKPSRAFGDKYRVFDDERVIARLPGPPFQFLDRITRIENCEPWVLKAGAVIDADYDIPPDAWYFEASRQPTMPFAVLLETALQPCGWMAAYLGSALTSETDLSFRNLGGTAVHHRPVTADLGTLTTTVKMTRVSQSGGMIIQHFDFDLKARGEPVYTGNTYFGFFSKGALADQVGIREALPYQPTDGELARGISFEVPTTSPYPDDRWRMVRTIAALVPDGGPQGLGFIRGTIPVDPSAWFFQAHFYQDPVWPGSLGLESFLQILQAFGRQRWPGGTAPRAAVWPQPAHTWVYRGQVIPKDRLVTVEAVITAIDDDTRTVTANGFLSVDGRIIYQMNDFRYSLA